jgi:hypothetical protein
MSLVFRVTRIRLWCWAVAANNPSMTGRGDFFAAALPAICPQRSATGSSIGKIRPEKRRTRSCPSQVSRTARRADWGREAIPLRISPRVRTLKKSRSSSVLSIHFVTLGSGLALISSEMTLVSRRNPLTVRPSVHSQVCDRDLIRFPPRVIPKRTSLDSAAGDCAKLAARIPQLERSRLLLCPAG